ncbi:hypothetical protein AXA44_36140 [Rhodococcus sp. SC4]|nr:hypothetical protein AXA44_36140 [Rhodococcus sp. SC4]
MTRRVLAELGRALSGQLCQYAAGEGPSYAPAAMTTNRALARATAILVRIRDIDAATRREDAIKLVNHIAA